VFTSRLALCDLFYTLAGTMPLELALLVDASSPGHLLAGAGQVVAAVRPAWPSLETRLEIVSGGMTNALVSGWTAGAPEDRLLVRVYGEGTDAFIDRAAERDNMQRLEAAGLGARLHAAFRNGLCYEFVQGEVLAGCRHRLQEGSVWRGVAARMARLHGEVTLRQGEEDAPCMWQMLRRFITTIAGTGQGGELPSKQELLAEADWLEGELGSGGDTVVFCHNDLQLGNVILQPDGQTSFIDFEYGAANYAAFDIAQHFVEFVGCGAQLNYAEDLPSREWQLGWVEHYLARREGRGPGPGEVAALQARVGWFMLAAHLLWGAWAGTQAQRSAIQFDFQDYAVQRLREYHRMKKLLTSQSSD
jgi:thiamine kinase-like enzyme